MQKKQVQLLTTSGCHLCERAYEMLNYLIEHDSEIKALITVQMVEIANDDALVEQYGIRIPILIIASRELGWPFELEELRLWLIQ